MDSKPGGRHLGGRRRGIEDYVRLACTSGDPSATTRPRRLAITARAAVTLGVILLVAGLALAARTVLNVPGMHAQARAAVSVATTGPGSEDLPGGGGASASPSAPTPVALSPADPLSHADGAGQLVVHVAGAVHEPGVITLPDGARVADAIEAAGGATQEADLDQLNLARPVADGEQVRVPRHGEDLGQWDAVSGGGPAGTVEGQARAGAGSGGAVSLNRASATELETLPGIGSALAGRIVDYRETHGPFTSVDQLTRVPGIGQAKLEALRDQVTL